MDVSIVKLSSWGSIGLILLILLAGCVGIGGPAGIPVDDGGPAGIPVDDGGSVGTPVDDVITVTGPEWGTDGSNFEYIETNDSVRVIIARDNDGSVRSRIVAFDEFARWECLEVGLNAVRGRLAEEFSRNPSVGTGHDSESITVWYYPKKILAPGKEVLQKALPDKVRVTIRVGPRNHTCSVPLNITEGGQPIPA
jgi:hypothetical protein